MKLWPKDWNAWGSGASKPKLNGKIGVFGWFFYILKGDGGYLKLIKFLATNILLSYYTEEKIMKKLYRL
ncbi:MAG: hypothetical protein U5N58_01775 [Actinomycetota bacterium]|nr:hypothetical protein [Actinomycetota bacterium]